jgi:hypothetical protein
LIDRNIEIGLHYQVGQLFRSSSAPLSQATIWFALPFPIMSPFASRIMQELELSNTRNTLHASTATNHKPSGCPFRL